MPDKPALCLTFDLEEFDLPLEYGRKIPLEKQMRVSIEGTKTLLPLLEKYNASCTFFTTANFAQHHPSLVKEIAAAHEIASHSFFHSLFHVNDLKKSKETLEDICGKKVIGFRMPRMAPVQHKDLLVAGYIYDSSLNPTCIPGRYNYFFSPRTLHRQNGLIIFPASVTPVLRIPLFWLSFKNFSAKRYAGLVRKCIAADGYANIYLHPWEFADLHTYSLPGYIAKYPGLMIEKLRSLLEEFKDKARFISIQQLLSEKNEL